MFVPRGRKGDDVVASREVIKGVRRRDRTKLHGGPSSLQGRDVAQAFAAFFRSAFLLFKKGVFFLEPVEERLRRLRSRGRGAHETFDAHIREFERNAALAREDEDLARGVRAVQIRPRVRFAEAELAHLPHDLAEFPIAYERVEYIAKRARKHAFYLEYFVAAQKQVFERTDDGERRPRIGLVQEFGPFLLHKALQFFVVRIGARIRFFVGRDDRNIGRENIGVRIGHLVRARAVDEHFAGKTPPLHHLDEFRQRNFRLRGRQRLLPLVRLNTLLLERHFVRVCDADDADGEIVFTFEIRALARDLREERAPDKARADQKDVHYLFLGKEERRVERIERFFFIAFRDDDRNIQFRRALRYRDDVDAVARQCMKEPTRRADAVLHPFAYDSDDRKVARDDGLVDEALFVLLSEFFIDSAACTVGVLGSDIEGYGILRGSLCDDDGIDPRAGESAEEPAGGAAHPQHTAPFHAKHGDTGDRGNAFGKRSVGCRLFSDNRAGGGGDKRVLDEKRDSFFLCGAHRRRVDDFRAEVRHLHRLLIRHRRDRQSVGHFARVGRHDAGDIGPYLDDPRGKRRAENGGAIIASAAPQGRRVLVGSRSDEASHDLQLRMFPEIIPYVPVGRCEIDRRLPEIIIGHDYVARVEVFRRHAAVGERFCKHTRGEPLPVAHDVVECARREFSHEVHAPDDVVQIREERLYLQKRLCAMARPDERLDRANMTRLQFRKKFFV